MPRPGAHLDPWPWESRGEWARSRSHVCPDAELGGAPPSPQAAPPIQHPPARGPAFRWKVTWSLRPQAQLRYAPKIIIPCDRIFPLRNPGWVVPDDGLGRRLSPLMRPFARAKSAKSRHSIYVGMWEKEAWRSNTGQCRPPVNVVQIHEDGRYRG